ncbi:MAG: YdeI/OmpD-associated family protein [Actinomycetia bacterium]|nr:YdeI/OmpD-associated family protein [Actinomycetes bacterium]
MTRRVRRELPDDVYQALVDEGLLEMYEEQPAYQQNDYVGWISRAKTAETRQKRFDQMLDELRKGGVYMKMDHRPSARK